MTLKVLLENMDLSKVIEVWRIRRIGGLSRKDNLVVLFIDGTHICTCMETITKGIICRHFWRVMLYSDMARFHISIIPIRWYKDDILTKLDTSLNNTPVLTAIGPSTNNTMEAFQIDFTLQSLRCFQGSDHKDNIQHIIPRRNRFGIAFSTAKTAINIALETKSDGELVQLLKEFIEAKQKRGGTVCDKAKQDENKQDENAIVVLQQQLIDQTTDPNVTKIRGAPCKRRLKNSAEVMKQKGVIVEITGQVENKDGETSFRSQRKCLLCGKPGHYQKRCTTGKENNE